MRPFSEIIDFARQHHTDEEITAGLTWEVPKSASEIAAITDDRLLAMMAVRVFSAGFSRKVIDAKWPAFEEAFWNFSPERCAAMDPADLDELLANKGIVRNGPKILSVRENAHFLLTLADDHGSAAQAFAQWPDDQYFDLVTLLRRDGSRLGGDTGMRFLRDIGKPALVLTKDVVAALIREDVVASSPSSRKAFAAVQAALNVWQAECGLSLTAISRYLAWSVG